MGNKKRKNCIKFLFAIPAILIALLALYVFSNWFNRIHVPQLTKITVEESKDFIVIEKGNDYPKSQFDDDRLFDYDETDQYYKIIDKSNSTTPKTIGYINRETNSSVLLIRGNIIFHGDETFEIFEVIDQSLFKRGEYTTKHPIDEMEIGENYAILADWETGLYILDFSNLEKPSLTAYKEFDYYINSIIPHGDIYYINTRNSIILDMANPQKPIFLNGSPTYHDLWKISDIIFTKKFAFIAENGLGIFDITDPLYPIKIGRVKLGDIRHMEKRGNLIFIQEGFHDGLIGGVYLLRTIIVDVTNPLIPKVIRGVPNFNFNWYQENCFVKFESDGLHMVNLTFPRWPREVAYFGFPNWKSYWMEDEYIYIYNEANDYYKLKYNGRECNIKDSIFQ